MPDDTRPLEPEDQPDEEMEVTLVDTGADGTADAVIVDEGADGTVDAVALDTDGDGTFDVLAVDTDSDGEMEIVMDTETTNPEGDLEAEIVEEEALDADIQADELAAAELDQEIEAEDVAEEGYADVGGFDPNAAADVDQFEEDSAGWPGGAYENPDSGYYEPDE